MFLAVIGDYLAIQPSINGGIILCYLWIKLISVFKGFINPYPANVENMVSSQ